MLQNIWQSNACFSGKSRQTCHIASLITILPMILGLMKLTNFLFFTFRINFIQHGDANEDEEDTYEFEFYDTRWTRSADKISFLPARRSREQQQQRRRRRKPKEPSLVWALIRSFGQTFVYAGVLKFFQDLLNFVSPQLLK